jgi:hypothetical protein
MAHLVEQFIDLSLNECSDRLSACLDYLVEAGSEAAKLAAKVAPNRDWGLETKRVDVVLPGGEPNGIGQPDSKQSLAEVINQTANIQRMLDALTWVMSEESGLSRHKVIVCHPTTSSGTGETDLVLSRAGFPDAKFEVTDVIGNKDGNGKEAMDLKSLGFINEITRAGNTPLHAPPEHRGFLVVSRELGCAITDKKRWWRCDAPPMVRYEQ